MSREQFPHPTNLRPCSHCSQEFFGFKNVGIEDKSKRVVVCYILFLLGECVWPMLYNCRKLSL